MIYHLCSLPHPKAPSYLIFSLISMAISEVFGEVLFPFVESYKDAKNEKNRALVVKNAADAVLKSSHLLEEQGVGLPKDLKTVRLFHSLFLSTFAH
jgi:hypothetical protein